MSYCTISYMQVILPKTITIGDDNATSLDSQGVVNSITPRQAQLYIQFASQEIDSRLSTVYLVPLKRVKVVEADLTSDCRAGSTSVSVADNGPFKAGCLVRLGDNNGNEVNEIDMLPDDVIDINTVALVKPASRNFTRGQEASLGLVAYPDPIPIACARIAVATIIDRLFVAEQHPDISNYGKTQRTLAAAALDEIMAGSVRLNGQEFVGRRFVRMQLRDTMNTSAETQRGGSKEV